ncbi:tubulin-specific chaperone A [Rhizoctonia solani]|uniref:Tubulin-specific chaperone A n=1 Tax=Rhizoctonia solani TaxID=456999 RepID=A0A8H8SS70_9AGAM|nr:tubulin-specific chaperone A [Rhizoctonia solani]QRW16496.1 tubulin-specific chaperone A [Rhizoctonia solani]
MSQSDIDNVRRQMKIKTGSVKRLWKEHNMYRQEALQLKSKLDKLVAEGADEYDIKNAVRLSLSLSLSQKDIEEGEKMIPDSENRLAKAIIELRELVVYARTVPAFENDQDFLAAETQLEEANV